MMKYEISISDRKTFLHIRVNEPVTAQLFNVLITEAAKKSIEHMIDNFLYDLRRAPNHTSEFVHYNMAYHHSRQLGYSPRSKHALVVNNKDVADYRFVETILINAGYQGRLFINEKPAVEWLENHGTLTCPPYNGAAGH